MSIAETELKLLEELKQLEGKTENDITPPEKIIEEKEKVEEQKEIEEESKEEVEEVQEEVEEQEEAEEAEEEKLEEPEEKLTGAKFRHKLKAEKEAREKAEREIIELRERMARLEGRAEAMPQPQKEEVKEEIPDPTYEPEKFAIWKAEQAEKKITQLEQSITKTNAERLWENMQQEYSTNNPTYTNAKKYLYETESAKIKKLYPYASESQIREHLKLEEYKLVGNLAKQGHDPIQYIEYLAYKEGFRPEATKAPIKKEANISNIKKNAEKSASLLGGSSAAKTGNKRSADQLAAMGIAEIEKMGRANYENAIRELTND